MSGMTPAPTLLRRARAVVVGLLLLLVTAAVAPAAQAHDVLVDSRPSAGEVQAEAPDAVVLTFSSPPPEVGSAIAGVDASGATVAEGEGTVEGSDVVLTLTSPLPAGDLEVHRRVASSDGHPIEGTIPFTLDAPAAEPAAQTGETDAAADDGGLASLPAWAKVVVGVAALGAVVGLIVLVVKRLREDRM